MFEWIASPEAWVALFTLAALEIVLGIDNIIFISILVSRLPEKQRRSARLIGLGLAMGTRILLLFSLAWMMRLVDPLFSIMDKPISGRDLILFFGACSLWLKVRWNSLKQLKVNPTIPKEHQVKKQITL